MPKLPQPNPGLADDATKPKGRKTAASALHSKTRVMKFSNFDDSLLPAPPTADHQKCKPDSPDDTPR